MESFHLVLFGSSLSTKDIETWLATALWRNLRELFLINEYSNEKPNILPSRLYTCKSLVILKLRGEIRLDVPRLSCLPSLKTFELILDKYFQGGPLRRLLSICPVLENLLVNCGWDDYDKGLITVTVPSLQRLTLYLHSETEGMLPRGLVIARFSFFEVFETPGSSSMESSRIFDWDYTWFRGGICKCSVL